MGDLLATLRNRNFALLWSGGLISMTGDWMLLVALPIYVYQATGSALATGAMFAAGLLPNVLFGSVAGVFVDRWDRKKTLVFGNALLTLSVLPLLLVPQTGWLWVVYAVAFVQSCFGIFNEPAENSLLPALVGEERLATANSLNATNNNLARLAGPALAGLVVGWFGLVGVVAVDAASYLVSAALVSLISAPTAPERPEEAPPVDAGGVAAAFSGVWREWAEGLRLVGTGRVILTVFVVGAVTGLGEGVFLALFPPFVRVALGGGALELGWLMSAQAMGGVLGGLVVGAAAARLSSSRLLGLGAVLFGLIDLAIFVRRCCRRPPRIASGAACSALWGPPKRSLCLLAPCWGARWATRSASSRCWWCREVPTSPPASSFLSCSPTTESARSEGASDSAAPRF
jgi:Transmembrane secretion effector